MIVEANPQAKKDEVAKADRKASKPAKIRLFVTTNFTGLNLIVLANATDSINTLRENIEKLFVAQVRERINVPVNGTTGAQIIGLTTKGFSLPIDYVTFN
eukprot:TRINITY_DN5414_c0_g1_i5.p2 TRINITY_DN5414_c0_g1~~TRINITY_DN5414_c0_g1_i5.p2  ORF type:complete len:100 (-),score=19.50 TRINITY_DN5414_c0_g1_i5:792-1091(-)